MESLATVEFFSLAEVCSLTGLTEETVEELADERIILSMSIATGEKCYPQFQFGEHDLRGELISLFQEFSSDLSGWEITCWFYKKNSYLDCTPIEYTYDMDAIRQLKLLVNSLQSFDEVS